MADQLTVLTIREILDFEALVAIVKVDNKQVLLFSFNSTHLDKKEAVSDCPLLEPSYAELVKMAVMILLWRGS